MQSEHTPTPWVLLPPDTDANGYHLVVGGTGQNYGLVATFTLRADAEYTLAAVNAPTQARVAELEAEVARLREELGAALVGWKRDQETNAAHGNLLRELVIREEKLRAALEAIVDLQGQCAGRFPLSENQLRNWAIANRNARAALGGLSHD